VNGAPEGEDPRSSCDRHEENGRRLALRAAEVFGALAAVAHEPADFLRFEPAEDRWSAGEVLDHVRRANRYLLIIARKIAEKSARRRARGEGEPSGPPAPPLPPGLATDGRPWPCPPHMTPDPRAAAEEAREELARQAEEIAELAARCAEGRGTLHRIRCSPLTGSSHAAESPHGDRLDLAGWLDFLLLHAERHLFQIRRNRETWRASR